MRVQPGLFVVDEAHLVSQWGQDFRPDYLRLSAQADALGANVRMALTATAAPPVREEIIKRLGLQEPKVVIGDFNRPEISLSVHRVFSRDGKRRAIERAASDFRRVRDRLRRHACGRPRGQGCSRRGRTQRDALPRGAPDSRQAPGHAVIPRWVDADHGRHGGVRNGYRQGRCALGRARRPTWFDRRLLPRDWTRRAGRKTGAGRTALPRCRPGRSSTPCSKRWCLGCDHRRRRASPGRRAPPATASTISPVPPVARGR